MADVASDNPYESRQLLEEYLLLHYAPADIAFPWAFGPKQALDFPVRCVTEQVTQRGGRALELGCSVGRACWELSVLFDEVIGIDYSRSFIEEARRVAQERRVSFGYRVEGELEERVEVELDPRFRPERVSFEVGDATALRADLSDFDLVIAANLLCRVPDPAAVLGRLPELVRGGGQLLLTSPYTWDTQYTPRSHWLGGFLRDGQPVRSLESLRSALEGNFELESCTDMPFLIREHARKFQWSVAQATRWRRH